MGHRQEHERDLNGSRRKGKILALTGNNGLVILGRENLVVSGKGELADLESECQMSGAKGERQNIME